MSRAEEAARTKGLEGAGRQIDGQRGSAPSTRAFQEGPPLHREERSTWESLAAAVMTKGALAQNVPTLVEHRHEVTVLRSAAA